MRRFLGLLSNANEVVGAIYFLRNGRKTRVAFGSAVEEICRSFGNHCAVSRDLQTLRKAIIAVKFLVPGSCASIPRSVIVDRGRFKLASRFFDQMVQKVAA